MITKTVGDSVQLLFLVRSLNYGGAERQVVMLATRLKQKGESVAVASFYAGGLWGRNLEAAGVPLYELGKSGRWDFLFLFRFIKLVRELRPTILYSPLCTANIVSVVCKLLFPHFRIVWGVRASNMDLRRYGWVDRLLYRVECALSHFVDRIIANSYAGLNYAVEHGFPYDKMVIISNGIDTEHFRPDHRRRQHVRHKLNFLENERVIGLIARLDPMKDHFTFLKATALLVRKSHNVRFLCVGKGPKAYELRLRHMGEELGIAARVTWLSCAEDMVAIYNAMDVMTSSSSFGEGFSNVIGEAMACGVPCVVTDVGDSKRIVGETGCVIAPGDAPSLCAAWLKLIDLDSYARGEQGKRARSRIVDRFSVERLVADTWDALKAIN